MARKSNPVDESTIPGKFAALIRDVRDKQGKSVQEVAADAGIPATTLFAWERGNIPLGRLDECAAAYGCEVVIRLRRKA